MQLVFSWDQSKRLSLLWQDYRCVEMLWYKNKTKEICWCQQSEVLLWLINARKEFQHCQVQCHNEGHGQKKILECKDLSMSYVCDFDEILSNVVNENIGKRQEIWDGAGQDGGDEKNIQFRFGTSHISPWKIIAPYTFNWNSYCHVFESHGTVFQHNLCTFFVVCGVFLMKWDRYFQVLCRHRPEPAHCVHRFGGISLVLHVFFRLVFSSVDVHDEGLFDPPCLEVSLCVCVLSWVSNYYSANRDGKR